RGGHYLLHPPLHLAVSPDRHLSSLDAPTARVLRPRLDLSQYSPPPEAPLAVAVAAIPPRPVTEAHLGHAALGHPHSISP
ncbi:hypothetical protein KI387_011412, partial [Taxus chinensis]